MHLENRLQRAFGGKTKHMIGRAEPYVVEDAFGVRVHPLRRACVRIVHHDALYHDSVGESPIAALVVATIPARCRPQELADRQDGPARRVARRGVRRVGSALHTVGDPP